MDIKKREKKHNFSLLMLKIFTFETRTFWPEIKTKVEKRSATNRRRTNRLAFFPAAGTVPTQSLHSRHRGKKYNENGQGIFLSK
jgi:hypothetical protein